ncbi:MAG: hypothetical protein GQ574_10340 [Crocinitomix sp.]|nr:hypothetical protein [Crocinitomix sp.]
MRFLSPKFCVLYLSFFLLSPSVFAQPTTSIGRQSNYIKKIIEQFHYNKIDFNDEFSEQVFDGFIEEIDAIGMFYYQTDIDELKAKHYHSIDEEIKQSTAAFFTAAAGIYYNNLIQCKERVERLLADDIDWTKTETLSYEEADYTPFPANEKEMDERWRLWLKSEVLEGLFSGEFHPNPYETSIDSVLQFEAEVKEKLLEMELYEIKSFTEHPLGYNTYLSSYYLDAIAHVVDPHTAYFSPNEQEDFVDELSKDNLAFGIQFDENDKGDVIVYDVMPGSPAWVSGELAKEDVVLSLKLGDQKKLDLTTAGMAEIEMLFGAFNEEVLTLVVRKANGQTKEVVIEQGLVYVDQDVIKSVLLDGEKKIGYITLPDFYTNWDDPNGKGCANDVAKTIVKLKKESIDGLILDLRNNGGGSVREAIDLAGMFINYGPLSIVQEQSREPQSIKDFNKGSIYNGPLVILVNGLSASASELFTAAMQDHNRAIVVGSTTYGKGTGQVMMPLDPNVLDLFNTEPLDESLGYLKVTTSKYYRVVKSTHQKGGIQPDVALPDVYDIYDYRESTYENALSSDSVVKKIYYTAASPFPIEKLRQASQNRLAASSFGNALVQSIDSLIIVMNAPEKYDLNIENYQRNNQALNQTIDSLFSYLNQSTDAFEVKNNQYDLRIMEMNAYRSELNDAYLKRLTEDIYLDEAYRVLIDYIGLGK